jgi:hypothetical protein
LGEKSRRAPLKVKKKKNILHSKAAFKNGSIKYLWRPKSLFVPNTSSYEAESVHFEKDFNAELINGLNS